jgi:glutamate formiminotransferase / formiminotetrahydrofolate cyclodeaminase
MKKIVECIPNFSEGRDQAKIDLIRRAIASVSGVAVLDRHVDPDHNRSVITFAGEPDAVLEAGFRAAETAVELIDLNVHTGEHPRIGALDVLPFVPIKGVTMEDCIALARRAGERIARELEIPVYLYERAATRPDRTDLANLRRGEFEGLRREIEEEREREPDFGKSHLHPTAGAIAVAARPALIAVNINLATDDMAIAARIAKAVRGSSGGLQYVKALSMKLEQRRQAQVSMNVVNFEATPLYRVFDMVCREAQRYGVLVAGTEIVGLVPQAALDACSDYYLRLENFSPDLVLENRLLAELAEATRVNAIGTTTGPLGAASAPPFAEKQVEPKTASLKEPIDAEEEPDDEAETPIATFADVITSGSQTPDGVSIAAYAGALGASLGGVICRLTMEKQPQAMAEARGALEQFEQLRADLHHAINEDAETREIVQDAFELPRETIAENLARASAIEEAYKNAIAIPLRVAENAFNVLELLGDLTEIGNNTVFADIASAAQMAMTAMRAAAYNIFASMDEISDEEFNRARHLQITQLVTRGQRVANEIESMFFRRNPQ